MTTPLMTISRPPDLDPTNFVGYNNLGAVYNRLANAYLEKAKALREEKDRQEALLTG